MRIKYRQMPSVKYSYFDIDAEAFQICGFDIDGRMSPLILFHVTERTIVNY